MTNSAHSEIRRIFQAQRANRWHLAQSTAEQRIARLKKLREAILARADELRSAIHADFGKNPVEVDITELYPAIAEINHTIRHLGSWMKPERVKTPLVLFGTRSEIRHEPKGVVLILSPWNYPFYLLLAPLVSALAAGNCVVLKPSSKVPATSRFLKSFFSAVFPENEVMVIEGGHEVSDALLELPFDHIFFTGSTAIGKKVMAAAAKHLATVTLELGGKSPVVIDQSADLRKTAERVMWAKFINAGQTCVAPDYILIHESRLADFVRESKAVLAARFGKNDELVRKSPDLARLVSRGHLEHLKRLLDDTLASGARIEAGGAADADSRYFAPTVLTAVTPQAPVMQEEIFGPILPVLTFRALDEAIAAINSRDKPLALYIFSEDDAATERILANTSSGGSCVNSLVVHLANTNLPFGGVGASGMGNYHGRYGFVSFSHQRAVLRQGTPDLLRLFYPPYGARVRALVRFVTKHLT